MNIMRALPNNFRNGTVYFRHHGSHIMNVTPLGRDSESLVAAFHSAKKATGLVNPSSFCPLDFILDISCPCVLRPPCLLTTTSVFEGTHRWHEPVLHVWSFRPLNMSFDKTSHWLFGVIHVTDLKPCRCPYTHLAMFEFKSLSARDPWWLVKF